MDHHRSPTDRRPRIFTYHYFFFSTWLKAFLARAPVSFATLLAMRLREFLLV